MNTHSEIQTVSSTSAGRKAIVYGGSGGIGAAAGRLLRDRGWDLHLVARNQDRLAAVAEELGAAFTAGDVRDPGLFGRVAAEAGEAVHGLIYAVGTITLRSLQRLSEQEFLDDFRRRPARDASAD